MMINPNRLLSMVDKKTYEQMGGLTLDSYIKALGNEDGISDLMRKAYMQGYMAAQADVLDVLKEDIEV